MDINKVTAVYFVGAGGIGMSALIRYFLAKGKRVGGYDKTPSDLTEELKKEGADIHYEDNVALIGEAFKSPDDTLVVYTPAVPESHTELTYFRAHDFEVMKRARVLGEITKSQPGFMRGGNARQDNYLFYAGSFAETIASGLQCFPRRNPKELRE